mgnify:CR=1 FL=1
MADKKRDHPRLRGEYRISPETIKPPIGSPPLARGIPLITTTVLVKRRITPACAGNTYAAESSYLGSQDHPRLRGEYICRRIILFRFSGSPPLARGIHMPPNHLI